MLSRTDVSTISRGIKALENLMTSHCPATFLRVTRVANAIPSRGLVSLPLGRTGTAFKRMCSTAESLLTSE